ncbi:MAG: hypothetical protein JWM44_2100 [Bacilli bacterium]|nr:hypothetical protein [Bacilli bacterium]
MDNQVEAIPIEEICKKFLKGVVLDVFFIILNHEGISKKEIGNIYLEEFLGPNAEVKKSQSQRQLINESIAKLEGALLVNYYEKQAAHMYALTPYGEVAKRIIGDMVEKDPSILMGSIVVKKTMLGSGDSL